MMLQRVLGIFILAGSLMPANALFKEGNDANNAENAFIQNPDPVLTGGGRDQNQLAGDDLIGSKKGDLLIGHLGPDILIGAAGRDVLIGGKENFSANNKDRAFGGSGSDTFIWTPGDGSDRFDGGKGTDVVVLALLSELVNGEKVFKVEATQERSEIFINEQLGLPELNFLDSPGRCEVKVKNDDNAAEFEALDADSLVTFIIRAEEADGIEDGDNGVRVTLTLKDVEFMMCTNPDNEDGLDIVDLKTGLVVEDFNKIARKFPPEPVFMTLVPLLEDFFNAPQKIFDGFKTNN